MKTGALVVDGREVAPLLIAATPWDRARGMLLRRPLPPAMLLTPCASVHGVLMTCSLDVAFLSADGRVLETAVLRPWGLLWPVRRARAVLEAPMGSFTSWGVERAAVVGAA